MIPKSHPYYLALCGVETLAADHSELQESDDREQDGNGDRYAFIDLFIYAQISSDFKSLSSLQCGTKNGQGLAHLQVAVFSAFILVWFFNSWEEGGGRQRVEGKGLLPLKGHSHGKT